MMATSTRKDRKSLVERVRARISAAGVNEAKRFSPEVVEALQLAEQFADIVPDTYVLPLDALAGFQAEAGRKMKIMLYKMN
jgi:hypothetical protein